jgi:hypothetical protein
MCDKIRNRAEDWTGRNDLSNWWRDIHNAIIVDLPALNRAATRERDRVSDLIQRFTPLLTAAEIANVAHAENLDAVMARKIIGAIAFPAASVDTHLQREGSAAGAGYRVFNGLVENLTALSRIAKHPPTHSHVTYWLLNNRDVPRTFTGGTGEIHFNRAVNGTNRAKAFVCGQITPIADGNVELDDPEAAVRLNKANGAYEEVHRLFVDYKRPEAAGCPVRMPQTAFMLGMRPFLVATEIGGNRFTGPNAANILSWIESDFRIGFRSPFYETLVRNRYPTMVPEELPQAEAFMRAESVAGAIANRLGLRLSDITAVGHAELVRRCISLPEAVLKAIKAFGKLAMSARTTSMVHFAHINFYVQRAAALLNEAEKRTALVREGLGVSGTSIEDGAARIAAMRKDHRVVSTLIDVAKNL